MRLATLGIVWFLGSCGGEPVVPAPKVVPESKVVVKEVIKVPSPVTVGDVSPWRAGGALEKVMLKPGSVSLAEQLKGKYAEGVTKGLKPYVMVYSDECEPCVALRKNLSDPLMAEAFQGVLLILLNQAEWGAYMHEVRMKSGSFPRIHELTNNGQASDRMITGEAWGKDIPANMAPPLKTFLRQ